MNSHHCCSTGKLFSSRQLCPTWGGSWTLPVNPTGFEEKHLGCTRKTRKKVFPGGQAEAFASRVNQSWDFIRECEIRWPPMVRGKFERDLWHSNSWPSTCPTCPLDRPQQTFTKLGGCPGWRKTRSLERQYEGKPVDPTSLAPFFSKREMSFTHGTTKPKPTSPSLSPPVNFSSRCEKLWHRALRLHILRPLRGNFLCLGRDTRRSPGKSRPKENQFKRRSKTPAPEAGN